MAAGDRRRLIATHRALHSARARRRWYDCFVSSIRDFDPARAAKRASPTSTPQEARPQPAVTSQEQAPAVDRLDLETKPRGPALHATPAAEARVPHAALYSQTPTASAVTAAWGSVGATIHHASAVLGERLQNAGALFHDAGSQLSIDARLSTDAHSLGDALSTLGARVAVPVVVLDAAAVRAEAQGLADQGQGLVGRARAKLDQGVAAFKSAMTKLSEAANRTTDAVIDFTVEVVSSADYQHHIALLGPGDRYELGLEAFVDGLGARVVGESALEVSRTEDGFTLEVAGALGAGLALGTNALVFDGEVAGSLTGGGSVSYQFDSAEAATRAVDVLLGRARANESRWAELKPFLREVELTGTAGGEVFSSLGAVVGPSARLIAEAEAQQGFVFRAGTDTEPPSLEHETVFSSQFDARSRPFRDSTVSNGLLEVTSRRRYLLPQDFSLSSLVSQPREALRTLRAARADGPDELTVNFETARGGFGERDGRGGVLTLQAEDASALVTASMLNALRSGDITRVLEALPDTARLEGTLRPHRQVGVRLTPGLSLASFGVELEYVGQRTDARPEEGQQVAGAPKQVARAVLAE